MFIEPANQFAPLQSQDAHDAAAGSQSHRLDALATITCIEGMPLMTKDAVGPPTGTPPSVKMSVEEQPCLYPFFHYRDRSKDADPDPMYPLVPPGRVPNFPAKMHAILSRPDLEDIIAFMPHGRSWRVLKPREFELKVIPQYFDHAKYSSFVRQANGWGFRRITQGKDQGSYYHPKFLRGLPHLCKTMKRLAKKGKKRLVDSNMEPDLFRISELHPLPEQAEEEAIMLNCISQGDPQARVPVFDAQAYQQAAAAHTTAAQVLLQTEALAHVAHGQVSEPSSPTFPSQVCVPQGLPLAPLVSLPAAAEVGPTVQPEHLCTNTAAMIPKSIDVASSFPNTAAMTPKSIDVPSSFPTSPFPLAAMMTPAGSMPFPVMVMMPTASPAPAPAPGGVDGSASFAAGFAAATAFSQQHFSKMLQAMAEAQK